MDMFFLLCTNYFLFILTQKYFNKNVLWVKLYFIFTAFILPFIELLFFNYRLIPEKINFFGFPFFAMIVAFLVMSHVIIKDPFNRFCNKCGLFIVNKKSKHKCHSSSKQKESVPFKEK